MKEKPKGHAHVIFQPSKEGCLLLDKKNDRIHSLNATAAFVWTFCDGKHALPEIEQALQEHWEKKTPDSHSEVESAIAQFESLGLLE